MAPPAAGSPDPPRPSPQPAAAPVPATVAREQVIARLSESFARDELSLAEFEGRVAGAYDATTAEALAALTTDLPGVRPVAAPVELAPLRVEAVLSNVERGAGPLPIPSRVDIHAFLGNVQLDWRGAELQPGVTEIALRNFLGNVEIYLPAHVLVEYQGKNLLGSFECRQHSVAAPGRPTTVVRLTGRTMLGSVTVTLG